LLDSLRNGVLQNLYTGRDASASMYLPLGDPQKHFKYDIHVTIMDRFYYGKKLEFSVTVCYVQNFETKWNIYPEQYVKTTSKR